jgi:hypothetical protein
MREGRRLTHYFGLLAGGLPRRIEQRRNRRLHGFEIEGLGQQNRVLESLGLIEADIAGGKRKRDAASLEGIGKRIAGIPAAKIYVKDRPVEIGAIGKRKSVLDGAAGSHDFAAKLVEPILNQHRDEGFVVNDENARHQGSRKCLPNLRLLTVYLGSGKSTSPALSAPNSGVIERADASA